MNTIVIELDDVIRDVFPEWKEFVRRKTGIILKNFDYFSDQTHYEVLISLYHSEEWKQIRTSCPPIDLAKNKINEWSNQGHKIIIWKSFSDDKERVKKWLNDNSISFDRVCVEDNSKINYCIFNDFNHYNDLINPDLIMYYVLNDNLKILQRAIEGKIRFSDWETIKI
jgi:hypothetical protein